MKKLIFDKKVLKYKYLEELKTIEQIAEELKCAPSVVCTNLEDFDIKVRPKGFKRLIEKEELEKKYIAGEGIRHIAKDFGTSTATVVYYLKYFNIKLHGQSGKYGCWFGKKNPESASRLRNLWNSPEFREKALKAPRSPKALKKNKLSKQKFWKSEEGIKLKIKRVKDGRRFYKNNKDHFIEIGKKGQAACPRISSVEIKVCKLLDDLNINFVSQYNYKLGIADIFIEPNKIIEVYGDYWHNYPKGREKDKKQIKYLKNNGYEVLIIWEHELKNVAKLSKKLVKYNNKKCVSAFAKTI